MFEVEKEIIFKASHKLYEGGRPNETDHFHEWRIRVCARSNSLNSFGFVIDYDLLERLLYEISDPLINKSFNNIPYFSKTNPTAEIIAEYFAKMLQEKLAITNENCYLYYVKIYKDVDTATYYPHL